MMPKTTFLIAVLISFSMAGQTQVSQDDFKVLLGKWTGNLTYIDYSSNEPYSMPANVNVSEGKNENQFILENEYPNEPKANGKGKINLSKSGEAINGSPVVSRKELSTGDLEVTTESSGKDNNQKALIRIIYVLGESNFVMRKEVKFEGSETWMQRNEFKYNR